METNLTQDIIHFLLDIFHVGMIKSCLNVSNIDIQSYTVFEGI